jgi:hypothetical protein
LRQSTRPTCPSISKAARCEATPAHLPRRVRDVPSLLLGGSYRDVRSATTLSSPRASPPSPRRSPPSTVASPSPSAARASAQIQLRSMSNWAPPRATCSGW